MNDLDPAAAIAIVGIAFRLPGDLQHEQDLWDALISGRDLVTRIDPSRWAVRELQHPRRSEPGRSITFDAGVLSGIDRFDAGFFGISPREAQLLDPQQRLLLEMAWEALEDAGIKPSSIAGSDCAVYLGISGLDYGMRVLDDLSVMGAHSMTGNTMSVAANRLSYVFDLRGPSLAVDTACSSSLVALHHACELLRRQPRGMALVGGINLLLHPYPFVGFTKASMLSAQGRCRPFAEGADGYVRAEGGAMLVLKPLAQALHDGDPIHGVIRASGVNTDGARKSGLTIPSGEAQAELMRGVLERSGLRADDIDFVEAHGTGTRIGDPIEAAAIGAVYGRQRAPAHALPIGSIKSNLGHLEPASGMAGLLKALLALRHASVPPTRVIGRLNPDIDFDALGLQVVRETTALPRHQRPLRAGVNSFGFGGVNAHVILEEAPAAGARLSRATTPAPAAAALGDAPALVPACPLLLGAHDESALRELARHYADRLDDSAQRAELAQAAWLRREWLTERLALADVHDPAGRQALRAFAQGAPAASALLRERVLPAAVKAPVALAWVYSGNGAQWVGMGQRLRAQDAVFAQALDDVAQRIRAHGGPDVLAVLDDEDPHGLDDTALAQPALFALQVACTCVLRARGLRADAAMGHSVGEIAAAWATGALTLDDASRVIVARSAAQARTRGGGRMAAVSLGAEALRQRLQGLGLATALEVGADNSPRNSTVTGDAAALQVLHAALRAEGVAYRELGLDYAFHSHAMEPIREPLLRSLQGLRGRTGEARLFSSVSGAEIGGEALGADYWWHNVRDCVRFGPALRAMADAGLRVFMEIGPHAILQRYLAENLDPREHGTVACAPRREDTPERLREAVLRAAMLGAAIDHQAWFATPLRRHVELPHYPWQRERHWYAPTTESHALVQRQAVHPLLGWRLHEPAWAWEQHLDPATHPWLNGHRVGGAVVLPAAAYAEMALAASREVFGAGDNAIEGLDIVAPVVFDGEHARTLRLLFDARESRFRIEGRQRLGDEPWSLHAQGRLRGAVPAHEDRAPRIARAAPHARIDAATHYALCERLGLQYADAFRDLHGIELEATCLRAELTHGTQAGEWLLAPAVLDQAFQAVLGWLQASPAAAQGLGYLPVGIGRLDAWSSHGAHAAPRGVRSVRAALLRSSPRSVLVDLELLDDDERVLARLHECRFRAAALVPQAHRPSAWHTVARLQPLQGAPAMPELPPPQSWLASLADDIEHPDSAEARALHQRYLEDTAPLLELLPLAYARDALRATLEADGKLDEQRLHTWRGAHPLLAWCLAQLHESGLLVHDDGAWQLRDDPQLPPAGEIWREALAACPAAAPELLRLGHAGHALPRLLAAEPAPPLACDFAALLQAPAYRAAHEAGLLAIAALARHWPAGRRLRVLELCASDSGLSGRARARLEALGLPCAEALDWVSACADTDAQVPGDGADPRQARAVALAADTLRPQLDDAEPAFDLVILHHVLHRAGNPVQALRTLGARMQPDACLLLLERRPDHAAQLGFGLDPEWWHGSDAPQPQPALLHEAAWSAWLGEQGWRDVQALAWPGADIADPAAALLGGFALAARAPARAASAGAPGVTPRSWVLHLLQPAWRDTAEQLAEALRAQDCPVRLLEPGLPAAAPDATDALDAATGETICHVLFSGCSTPRADALELAQQADALRRTLLQLAAAPERHAACVVCSGGALVDDPRATGADPAAAALWGLARVARNECHPLRLRLLDLGPAAAAAQANALLHELLHGDAEDEVLLQPADAPHATLRRVPRVQALALDEPPARADQAAGWRLDFRLPGQLRNLHWRAAPRREPGPGEVEIGAVAAGLNFRDVMYAMGLLSDEAVEQGFAGASLGLEVAGRVLRCGAGVDHLQPGDEVLAFAGASFASHVVVPAHAVARKPAHWSFAEAATVPTVFFTVWYALRHLARLRPGERVLVHGAAGGVGLAAIQVARLAGAEVYASAGSPAKREFLRLLGVAHVLDSRDPDFDREVLRASGGEGVHVVLNSLAGEAITRNLHCLRPFGRFVELGKRDFYENTLVGLRPFRNNLSYFGVDADQLMQLQPELATEVFQEVMQAFADGTLHPLPHRVFDADHVLDAFRHMQQARQIGKVVLNLQRAPRTVRAQQPAPLRLPADATYLVSGGLGGFGLACARWLARRGARHLALLGRRGMDTPGLEPALQELRAEGVQVRVLACDITQREALAQALGRLRAELPPLRGLVHAAMVLDDGLMNSLDESRLRRVLAPKLDGAWNLHELTADDPLDLFVLFSSATTLLGNPGQANYVAANAALEALARLRRARGLPACALAWGPIADVGVLTANATARDNLQARLGADAMASGEALERLEQVLQRDLPGAAVMNLDWPTLRRLLPGASAPRFQALGDAAGQSGDAGEDDLRRRLATLAPEQARSLVHDTLCREIAGILRLAPEKVTPAQSVFELGMDSLMAVELGLALERRFGVRVPPMLLNENPSIERIAERLLASLGSARPDPEASTRAAVQAMLAQHAEGAQPVQAEALLEQLREAAPGDAPLIL